jgi:hypothetical protein
MKNRNNFFVQICGMTFQQKPVKNNKNFKKNLTRNIHVVSDECKFF